MESFSGTVVESLYRLTHGKRYCENLWMRNFENQAASLFFFTVAAPFD